MRALRILFALLSPLLLFLGCSIDTLSGGSGSTTTNGMIVGTVVDESGVGAAMTEVRLFKSDYDPVKDTAAIPRDTSDAFGKFSFSHVPPQGYCVVAVHLSSRKRTIITGLRVAEDTIVASAGTLKTPGRMRVALPESINSVTGYVYVPGTSCFAFLNGQADSVDLDSLPPGALPIVSYSSTNSPAATVLRYDVPIAPGAVTVIGNPGWVYSRTLSLNTTTSGADVAGTVTHFPVLIRLNGTNFDFSTTKTNGADIRFAKSDGSLLPHEIERWDSAGGKAEIWVKVDTILGNSQTQSLLMYWGKTDAASGSNGSAVFDTGSGFAGVWHLCRSAGSVLPDATANGIHGTPTATSTVGGMVGEAQEFNGTSSLIRASGSGVEKLTYPETGNYSVSAWVKADRVDSLYRGIVYKSNFQYGLQIRPESTWEFYTFVEGTGWEGSRTPVALDSWHFLTGVRRGNQQYLYVDGVCVDSAKSVVSSNLVRGSNIPLEIGHCPDGGLEPDRYFSGAIDEVRISRLAASPDWIKLCYMNQKAQDALVAW